MIPKIMRPKKILFFGKRDDEHCTKALEFCKKHFSEVVSYLGDWNETFPKQAQNWSGDFIISYLSRWVIPEGILSKATSINFHPAPPEYPGIGCINFALYEGATSFGVTCHHIAKKVDTGSI